MTPEQEDALEVAKLAAMVGSQLRVVDQMTTERHNAPANRIDINKFVAQVKGQNVQQNPYNVNHTNPFGGMSPYLSEEQVQAMVPEPATNFVPPPIDNQDLASQMIPLPAVSSAVKNSSINNSDIEEIKESVKKIGNTLESLLELIQTTLNRNV